MDVPSVLERFPWIRDWTEADETGSVDEATNDATDGGRAAHSRSGEGDLPSIGRGHQARISPGGIERTPTAVRTGDGWRRTLWVGEYPDAPQNGAFVRLLADGATTDTDVTMHLRPRDTQATLDALENRIERLQADLEYLSDRGRAGARGVRRDLEDFQGLYDALRNTSTTAFDVSAYLSEHASEKDAFRTDAVRSVARQAPANLQPVVPRWVQLQALTSASPIGVDRLNETMDTTTPMLAGAVGALVPFVGGAVAEQGIEYGTYARTGSPVVLDRFERSTGYCMLTIGKLGAGKSFGTKLQLLRRAMFDGDTKIVLLDPMEGFASVNAALDGERITVGGTQGLNPLELQATPQSVLENVSDLDPLAEQISRVMAFFETFFEHVASNPLGDRKQTLRRAVQEAYARQGITKDPATHDNPSPTVRDVLDTLEAMLESPAEFGYVTDQEHDAVREAARTLLTDLRPSFREGGDFANLARSTELDLDSDVVYLDLHQDEGVRGRSGTSLMMQVLVNAVYERAKRTDEKVVFVIDEAHYLLQDASAVAFLETAVRHSRHYDLSMQFVTQTGGEFTLSPEARTIANLCSMTVIHRVDEAADQLAEWFGLNEREVEWVRSAKSGEEADGYSEALLGIDEEGWFPVRIRASDVERDVLTD